MSFGCIRGNFSVFYDYFRNNLDKIYDIFSKLG